jgi:hypothetical protein
MSSQDTNEKWKGRKYSHTIDENWVEPTSLAEAIEWRDQVLTELQDIQDQLGEPERLIEAHSMTDDDYRVWRGRAKAALKYKLSTYRRLKAWIQVNRSWATTPPPAPEELNPVEVAKRLRDITGQLYALFLAVGAYVDDQSENNLRVLTARYEHAASVIGPDVAHPTGPVGTDVKRRWFGRRRSVAS